MKQEMDIKVAANGRMVLPKAARELLGVDRAGVLVLSFENNQLRLKSVKDSIKSAQARYKSHAINDLSSQDFLKERRKEAALENSKASK